jgi:hypothetical protein
MKITYGAVVTGVGYGAKYIGTGETPDAALEDLRQMVDIAGDDMVDESSVDFYELTELDVTIKKTVNISIIGKRKR